MKCLSEIRQNTSVMHYILALFKFIKYTSYPMVLAFSFRKNTKVLGYSAFYRENNTMGVVPKNN